MSDDDQGEFLKVATSGKEETSETSLDDPPTLKTLAEIVAGETSQAQMAERLEAFERLREGAVRAVQGKFPQSNVQDAEDAVAKAFEEILVSLRRHPGLDQFGNKRPGTIVVARALANATDQWRGERKRSRTTQLDPHSVELQGDSSASPEDAVARQQFLALLPDAFAAALAALPERAGEIIARSELHGEELADIAADLGMTVPAVKMSKHRGLAHPTFRKRLRAAWAALVAALLGIRSTKPKWLVGGLGISAAVVIAVMYPKQEVAVPCVSGQHGCRSQGQLCSASKGSTGPAVKTRNGYAVQVTFGSTSMYCDCFDSNGVGRWIEGEHEGAFCLAGESHQDLGEDAGGCREGEACKFVGEECAVGTPDRFDLLNCVDGKWEPRGSQRDRRALCVDGQACTGSMRCWGARAGRVEPHFCDGKQMVPARGR